MKKNKYDLSNITFEEIKKQGLWKLSKIPLNVTIAKHLNTPEKIEKFRKAIIKEFNETKGLGAFLESLKVIAIAEGNIAELARKSKISRPAVYKLLSKDNNPRINTLMNISHNLGVDFKAVEAA
jgi:probable addiction module antidote protein